MKQILLFAFSWIILLGDAFSEENKLLFVQILIRHGDRSPLELYPNDPNPASVWPGGLAALTDLGKKQQYALGKYFRCRYDNFTTSSPLEINVMSSEEDRCLKSAETFLASFYAPDRKRPFDNNLPWHPVPVHYLPRHKDKYLGVNSDCPRADEEKLNIINSPGGQGFMKEHEEMFRKLSTLSGYLIANWTKAAYLCDALSIEKKYNLTIPSWVEPYWNELTNVLNLAYFWTYNSPLMHRLRAGPLIQKIIERMNQKINGEIPKLKFQIYSAHDTTIAAVLNALNLFNMLAPPYSSAVMFELFEMPDGVKSVRMLYQNFSKPEEKIDPPQILILEGCTEFCLLDYFINYTLHLIPEDWDQECQLPKSIVKKILEREVIIGCFLILMAVVMTVMSVFLLRKTYSRRQDKYKVPSVLEKL